MTIIAFDVNETPLDLRALDPPFADVFGDPALRPQWFAQMSAWIVRCGDLG